MLPALLALATTLPTQDTIPFEFVRNQILVQVHVGDRGPYTMLLDTGVNPSSIDLDVARVAGLPLSPEPVGNAAGAGSGRGMPIHASAIVGARLGRVPIDSIAAVALDHAPFAGRLGRPLHGILGYSFLAGRRIRIDYPARLVIVEPSGHVAGPGYRARLEMVPGDIIPLLADLEVNGVAVPVSLDTGASATLELFPAGAARAGITPGGEPPDTAFGARGAFLVHRGRADRVTLGDLELTDLEVGLPADGRGGERLGNLGNGFLQRFVLTLDYRAMTISIVEATPRR